MPPIVSIENLSLGFGDLTLFDGLHCDVEPGSILAVVGANGSGKSTFVKTLLGLQSPIAGRIEWPKGKPAEIGYLAQLTEFDRRFPIRVRDLAAMGAWQGFNPFAGLNKAGCFTTQRSFGKCASTKSINFPDDLKNDFCSNYQGIV